MPNQYTKANLRLLGGIYFAGLLIIFNIIAKYFVFVFKADLFLPLFSTLFLTLLVGMALGAAFAELIARSQKPWLAVLLGVLMALLIIPLYSLGLLCIYYLHFPAMFVQLPHWQDYFVIYGVMMVFFSLIAGIWLIPILGLAALYFKQHVVPHYQTFLSQQRNQHA